MGDVPINCALLTLSDTRTPETDTSGQTLQTLLQQGGHRIVDYRILPDDADRLSNLLDDWAAQPAIAAILVTGGTGIAPRDITPEVVQKKCDRLLPGFGELFRFLSWQQVGTRAISSRALAGVIGTTLIFVMPGSTKAVTLAMEQLILPELGHLTDLLRGRGHQPIPAADRPEPV